MYLAETATGVAGVPALDAIWTNMQNGLTTYVPMILKALVILIVAYIIAKLIARGIAYAINRTGFGQKAKASGDDIGSTLGKAVFWIVMLFALPYILGALGQTELLAPLNALTTKFTDFIPNLFGAGVIFGIGYAVASVVKNAATSFLRAAKVDDMPAKFGLTEATGGSAISKSVGTLLFALIIVPLAVAALDALKIEAIAGPAKDMLSSFINVIPNIIVAAIIMGLAFLIAKFASKTLQQILPTFGVDNVGQKVGVLNSLVGQSKLSTIIGKIAFFFITLMGLIQAIKMLGFAEITNALNTIIGLGSNLLLGSVVILFGIVAADYISQIVGSTKNGKNIAGFVRTAIIILTAAMGVTQMGIGGEIVNTAFTYLMGAFAVGAAIALGWGGKDAAGRLVEKWTKNL